MSDEKIDPDFAKFFDESCGDFPLRDHLANAHAKMLKRCYRSPLGFDEALRREIEFLEWAGKLTPRTHLD